jgi:hypothetical protein
MNGVLFAVCAEVLDFENAFIMTWHLGLLYKVPELKFSTSLINLIGSFLSERKFRVSVEREMFTPRDIKEVEPQGSVLSHTLYSLYIND